MRIGKGLPGVERVDSFWDYVDEADLIVFPDCHHGDLQMFLQENGYRVFGSRKGSELELFRRESKEHFSKLGIPVNHYEAVIGVENLRSYLKEHEDVWVKVSLARGICETFHSESYKLVEPQVDELAFLLGPEKRHLEFIIEDGQDDCTEVGYDGYCINGAYPKSAMVGLELKDKAYIGVHKADEDLPAQVTEFNRKIADTMRQYSYRNFFSTDIAVDRKGVAYPRDLCCRFGHPPSEVMQYQIKNLPDIVWYGAEGQCIDPDVKEPWAAEVMIVSPWAAENFQPIYFPEKIRDNVKLCNHTIIDGVDYAVPDGHIAEFGAVVATGKTKDEAIKRCVECCKQIEGYEVKADAKGLETAQEELDELESFGVRI